MENDFANESTDKETANIIRTADVQSSPEESVKTIKRAERYDLHPDKYKSMETTMNPEAEMEERVPASVNKSVKLHMKDSAEHANVIGSEVGWMDKIGKQIDYTVWNLFEKHKDEELLFEMNNRDRLSENGLEPHEYEFMDGLAEDMANKEASFGLEGDEKLLGQGAGVVTQYVRAVGTNKAFFASTAGIGLALGPAGAIVSGGVIATSLAVTVAVDAYKKTAAATFGELRKMKDEKGVPLNLPRETIDNISTGVGVVSLLGEAVMGKFLTKGFGKIANPASLAKTAAMKKGLDLLGHTVKGAAISGGEEVTAEIAAIVGENYAKGSQDEAGLLNAMIVTAGQIKNDKATQERLSTTAKVGAVGGGLITGATGAIATGVQIKNEQKQAKAEAKQTLKVNKVNEAFSVLGLQEDMLNVSKTIQATNLSEMSPEQMADITKTMFAEAGYEGKMFFNEVDLQTISKTNPELAAELRNLDVTESSINNTKSGVGVDPHKFLELVKDAPELADYMRMNPEAPNPLESNNFLETLQTAETQRQEIFASLGVDGKLSPEQTATLKTLDEVVEAAVVENTIDTYVDQFDDSGVIKEALPEKQYENFKDAQARVRLEVADAVVDEFNQREQRIENKVVRANDKIIKEQQLRDNERSLKLTERFKGETKKEFSPLAIDPETLPLDLKEAYLADKRLKSRKAFKKGGISLEESAVMAGYTDGQAMLKDLANAPTTKELAAQRKARVAKLRGEVKDTRGKSAEVRLNETFNEVAKLKLKELELMKNKEWAGFKGGIRKIALPLPVLAEINNEAKGIINKTKVGNVSPKQFNAGERILNRAALSHSLKNEFEAAFVNKNKSLLNSELTRESLKARRKINDSKKFMKRLTSKNGMAALKSAGKLDQVVEILGLFDLNPTVRKELRTKSYMEYVKGQESQGNPVVIPEKLSDIRQRGSDLTVEQHGEIVDALRTLEHQAKFKNKLLKKQEARIAAGKLATVEAIVVEAVIDLEEHPTFNPTRTAETPRNKESRTFTDKVKANTSLAGAGLTNMKNVATELDQEALKGKHYKSTGTEGLVKSETEKRAKLSDLQKQIVNIATDYSEKSFKAAFNEDVIIPEFSEIDGLGYGTMKRSSLWTLQAYMGDPDTRNRIANFRDKSGNVMSVETMQRVLDTHLTDADAKLVQNFVNIFKSYEAEAKTLHLNTTGVEPTMVEGVPVHHRGKVLDGGYVPANYLDTSVDDKIQRFMEVLGDTKTSLFGDKNGKQLYSNLASAEQTDQGRLMDRQKNSTRVLDTNFMNILQGFEEHIHDVSYRESGMDALKLLKNPHYKKAIISTVGEAKYDTMVNGAIETVGKVSNDQTSSVYSKHMKFASDVVKYFEQGFAINALGFNIKSVAMQPLSLGTASLRMGPKATKYISLSLGRMIKGGTTRSYDQFFAEAVEVNPDLATGMDNIDDTITKSNNDYIPATTGLGKKGTAVVHYKKKFVDASMFALQQVDIQLKAAVSLAAYSQFVNGDVKNFSKEKIASMSPEQLHIEGKEYVKQVSDLALTTSADIDKSAIEKIAIMRMFTRFYTDVRSQLNTGFSQVRKVRNAIKGGDINTAAIESASMVSIYMLNRMYVDNLYEEKTPVSELGKVNSFDSLMNWMGNTAMYAAYSPVDVMVGSLPVSRDIQFGLGGKGRTKRVSNWISRSMTDTTQAIEAMSDVLQGKGSISKKEWKALRSAGGLLIKGLPIKGAENLLINDYTEAMADFLGDGAGFVAYQIEDFIKKNEDVESQAEFVQEVKDFRDQVLAPQLQPAILPENALENMPVTEWDAVNSTTGAAGVYQFTEEGWADIINKAPDLGLTPDGRVTKDRSQQEKAMKWSLENNSKGLAAYNVDVNIKTLYGAHRFGLDDYANVEVSNNNEKLKEITVNEKLFEGFTTVKQVKDFIANKIKTKE